MKPYEDNPRSIKFHVKKYLLENASRIRGKAVVDIPAGNGITSRIVKDMGGTPLAFDLFPEYFKAEGIECRWANAMEAIPLEKQSADMLVCQEGIEHFSDQFRALREFNRVLKPGGTLIITTPNYSNLRAKLSYFLSESERFDSMMPPNEMDSVWMSRKDISGEIYFGHVFLTGIQKLRALAALAGFTIRHIRFTRIKTTSLLLLPVAYPFIFLANLIALIKNRMKHSEYDAAWRKKVYGEIFRLNISPSILVDGHLFVEFVKEKESSDVLGSLKSAHKEFGTT